MGGISIGGILWFLIIPFVSGYTHSTTDPILSGLMMIIWVTVGTLTTLIPVIGYPIFAFLIDPVFNFDIFAGTIGAYNTFFGVLWIIVIIWFVIEMITDDD